MSPNAVSSMNTRKCPKPKTILQWQSKSKNYLSLFTSSTDK